MRVLVTLSRLFLPVTLLRAVSWSSIDGGVENVAAEDISFIPFLGGAQNFSVFTQNNTRFALRKCVLIQPFSCQQLR